MSNTTIHNILHIMGPALCLATLLASPAHAATINVDTFTDSIASGDGSCTLREAIINANANDQSGSTDCAAGVVSETDTINLSAGTYTLTIPGRSEDLSATGDLDITELNTSGDLAIIGATDANGAPASIIDANGIDRIFDIFNPAEKANSDTPFDGVDVTLQNLRLTNGLADEGMAVAPGNQGNGGAVFSWRFNTLNINNCVFDNNQAVWDTNIDDPLTLNVDERTLSGHGGAVYSRGSITIQNSTFDNNQAYTEFDANTDGLIEGEEEKSGNGGGVFTSYQTLIEKSTFSNNTASNGGGLNTTGGFGSFEVKTSTFNENSAVMGGGINNVSPQVPLEIENTTVSGNTVTDLGAGINSDGTVRLTHVTVAYNRIPGGGSNGAGINYFGPAGGFFLANTLLVNNTTGSDEVNCGCTGGAILACSSLQVTTLGGNISSDFNCALNTANGDLVGPDPKIRALADNGGSTRTHALSYDSVAIDAGLDANCNAAGITTDQRDALRPQDGNSDATASCDVGAYERQPANTDLLISGLTASADPVTVGDQLTLSINITNTGPDSVSDSRLELTLPPQLDFVSGQVTGGATCTESVGTVTCLIGNLGFPATASITIVTQADTEGTALLAAIVSALEVDVDNGNNSEQTSVTINPAAVAPTASSNSSGGGGCSLSRTSALDPLLPILFLIAGGRLGRKLRVSQ